ncbi:MAG: type II restriction endonuclease [Christensenellales bacterium]
MYLDKSIEEKIAMFEEHLLETNRGFNYYVDWTNVAGFNKYNIELHALDALIGKKEDFDKTFVELLIRIPTVVNVFPFLFALSKNERKKVTKNEGRLRIVGTELDSEDSQQYTFYCNGKLEKYEIENYLDFFKQMGLKNLFQNLVEKSTIDYIVGVLVGMDSNGRKNRGGKAFELACEPMIRDICSKYDIEIITQKKFKTLKSKGIDISEDIANRKADFILIKNNICLNIEVNFFNGTGSKPEEIIDSYITRQANLKNNNIRFALITDGKCWKETTNQLRKGFRHLDYLLNYKMMKNGVLEEIINTIFTD